MVDFGTAYNSILGRPTLNQFVAIAHYAYHTIKIPSPKGAITIFGNQKTALHCNKRILDMVKLTPGSQPEKATPSHHPLKVCVAAI